MTLRPDSEARARAPLSSLRLYTSCKLTGRLLQCTLSLRRPVTRTQSKLAAAAPGAAAPGAAARLTGSCSGPGPAASHWPQVVAHGGPGRSLSESAEAPTAAAQLEAIISPSQ